jgi:hypothetical protein
VTLREEAMVAFFNISGGDPIAPLTARCSRVYARGGGLDVRY